MVKYRLVEQQPAGKKYRLVEDGSTSWTELGSVADELLPKAREREARLAALSPEQRKSMDQRNAAYEGLYGPAKGSFTEGVMNNFGAFANQTLNSATLGNADNINAAATKYLKLGPGSPQGDSFGDYKSVERQNRQDLREAAPEAAMAGDVAGYVLPGVAAYKLAGAGLRTGANVLINPTLRAATAARWAKLPGIVQYAGRLPVIGGIGAADYGLYRSTVDATNLEAQEGRDVGLAERGKMFAEGATDPVAWLAGPALSVGYRTGRGIAAGLKNAKQTGSIRPPPIPGQAGKTPLANLVTPSWVQAEVSAAKAGLPSDRQKALEGVLKRMKEQGMTVEDAYKKLSVLAYQNKTSVDEMAFELLGASNDQLAVALGSVAGDAQKIARTRLPERSASAPGRIQRDLRTALGLEGSDFYSLQDELYKKRLNEPDYSGPYGQTISPETWTGRILPILRNDRGSAREALNDAVKYATDTGELAVARELDELRLALDGGVADPPVLSTQALDYVDRMLGDMAAGVSASTGRIEVGSGIRGTQGRIRGSGGTGLDPETGLNVPRQVSAQYRAAGGLSPQEVEAGKQGALQFGRQAAGKGFDLEQLEREWAFEAQKFGVDGEPSELINGSLLMGWLRGIEDKISTSQTPGEVVRFLIGSDRQRKKLMAMLPKVTENMTKAEKAEVTKRVRTLLGDPKTGRPGRIERERTMFENQNRIIGNSQTAARNEAIQAQGGLQRAVMAVTDAVFSPGEAAKKVAQFLVRRGTMPDIYNAGINRELGDILFTSGRPRLKKLFDELRVIEQAKAGRRQISGGGTGGLTSTGRGPKPTSGAPVPPAGGGPKGGGFAAARAQGKVTPEERAVLLGNPDDDLPPIKGAGFTGWAPGQKRLSGFQDEVPRGSERFSDQRLLPNENKIIEMARNGYSNAEIAEELGYANAESLAQRITQIRKKIPDVDVPQAQSGRQASAREQILPLRQKGLSNAQIEARTGIPGATVKVIISQARKKYRDAGEALPDWLVKTDTPGPRSMGIPAGLRTDLGSFAGGAAGTGAMPVPEDTPWEQRLAIAVAGGLATAAGVRRTVGKTATQGVPRLGRPAPDTLPPGDISSRTLRPLRSGGIKPQTVVDDTQPVVIPPGYGKQVNPPLTIKSPGQVIAKGLRGLDRGLRAPDNERVIAPVLAAGKMRKPKKGETALEAMRAPQEVAQTIADAMRRGRATSMTDLARPKLGKMGQKNAQIVQEYRNRLQTAADSQLTTEALRTQQARAMKAAKDQLADLHGEVARAVSKNDEAAAVNAAREMESLRQQIADIKKATPVKARQTVDATLALIDTAILQADQALKAPGAAMRAAFEPSRRKLQRDQEILDLLTNPNRAKEAYRVSQAKPLGSHEIKGQVAAAAGITGLGIGAKALADSEAYKKSDAGQRALEERTFRIRPHTPTPENITRYQMALNALVSDGKAIQEDGKWTPDGDTARLLRAYQRMRGLTVKGAFNVETIEALEADLARAENAAASRAPQLQ